MIQVKLPASKTQPFHQEYHQSILLIILSLYHHIYQVVINPSVVPISFSPQKPSSVTPSFPSLSPTPNPSLATSNHLSNFPSAFPSVKPYNDPILISLYVTSVGALAAPSFLRSTFSLWKHSSVP